jgi:hypothetical protein
MPTGEGYLFTVCRDMVQARAKGPILKETGSQFTARDQAEFRRIVD